jgi:CBASS immunity sensor of nucleotide second messenger signals
MYETESKTLVDTKQDLQKRLEKIGLASSGLDFLIEKVYFDTELGDMKSDQRLCHQFLGSIMQNTTAWQKCSPLQLMAAYRDVAHLVSSSVGKPLSRENIEQTIQQAVDTYHTRSLKGIKLRLFHWEDPSFDLSQEWDVLLDWSNYFDRSSRRIPEPSIWKEKLIPQLEEAQRKVRSGTDSRLIHFRPSACLSAGIALGWAFSEVKGYTFEIEQGSEIWQTDIRPNSDRKLIMPEPILLNENADALCVEFSQIADVAPKVDQYIKKSNASFRARLSLLPDKGIGTRINGSEALAYANEAKQRIRSAVDMYRCSSIHLFYAGPLGLAILFGRLLNSMHADVQCYEEQEKGYVPACLLQAG